MSSSRLFIFVVWAMLALISHHACGVMPQPPLPSGKPAEQARLVEGYGKLPLSFEANQGQTAEEVKFITRGPGYALFLKPDEAVLTMTKPTKREVSGNARELTASPFKKGGLRGILNSGGEFSVPKIPPNPPFAKGGTETLDIRVVPGANINIFNDLKLS